MGLSNVFGLRRAQSSAASNKSTTSYRALNLRQTLLEPAPFKYPHAFMLRSPAKSFVVQAPDEPTCRLWESGLHALVASCVFSESENHAWIGRPLVADLTDCIGKFATRLQSGAFGQSASSSGIAPVWDPDTEADVCML